MTSRGDVIQALINKNNYKSYLEIGVEDGFLFDKITCETKRGVDINTDRYKGPDKNKLLHMDSDQFFLIIQDKFDIIFIDGDHRYLQVVRDINNALTHLNDGGVILLHDTNPPTEQYIQDSLCSDSFKAAIYAAMRNDLNVATLPIETGVTIISRLKPGEEHVAFSYEFFEQHKLDLIHLLPGETREALKNTLKI